MPDLIRIFGRHPFGRFVTIFPGFFENVPDSFRFLASIETHIPAVPKRLATAAMAIAAGDLDTLRVAAHQLAGTAAYLGLAEIVGIAQSIEAACDEGDPEAARQSTARLPAAIVATENEVLGIRFPGLAGSAGKAI